MWMRHVTHVNESGPTPHPLPIFSPSLSLSLPHTHTHTLSHAFILVHHESWHTFEWVMTHFTPTADSLSLPLSLPHPDITYTRRYTSPSHAATIVQHESCHTCEWVMVWNLIPTPIHQVTLTPRARLEVNDTITLAPFTGALHSSGLSRATQCKHTATHCNKLQYTATHCNTLQHSATQSNTL